ncbi:MAG: MMPL family transporter [Hyphomicrobiales bacterium]|nr:MMPL family transporter [Hyphomicrobiales bacterium]
MSALGFGLERLGTAALARPLSATAFLLAVTVVAAIAVVANIGFDGDTTQVMRGDFEEFHDFERLRTEFRDFSEDEILLVQSKTLNTAEGFERLRELHLELQLSERVDAVLSVFSLVEPSEDGARWQSALPAFIEDDEKLHDSLKRLTDTQPITRSLYADAGDAALVVVMPRRDGGDETALLSDIAETISPYQAEGFHIGNAGLPAIKRAIVAGIIRDQVVLTVAGTLVCAFIAYFVFRSVLGAIICTLPPIFSIVWLLGSFALTGTKINFLTTVVPVLVLVIAFADGLHLYFQWRRACDEGTPPEEALDKAIRWIGPACALATLTTSVAFLSIGFGTNRALNGMALIGAFGVFASFIAVITVMPLAIHWLLRAGVGFHGRQPKFLVALSPAARRFVALRPMAISLAGLVIGVAMSLIHINIGATYRITDYLPHPSDVRESEAIIDSSFGGSGQIFAIVTAVDDGIALSPADIHQVAAVEDVMAASLGRKRVASIASHPAMRARTGDDDALAADIPTETEPLLRRFVNADRSAFLVAGFITSGLGSAEIEQLLGKIGDGLAAAELTEATTITGFPILSARETTRLVERLKIGLSLAVVLSIFVVGIAFRSARLAIACLIPNVLPIFTVEAMIWGLRGDMDMTIAVALTIAFGIAVDGSVHLLNQYRLIGERGDHPGQEMEYALVAIAPALVATTLVISAGLMVTLLSSLPMAKLFGLTVVVTLLIALIADVFVLPAMALVLEKAFGGKRS